MRRIRRHVTPLRTAVALLCVGLVLIGFWTGLIGP